ncbi:GntR family transcriptional regulator [Rhodococcus sp. RS1C4]|uniref:GntR family transcriptional regulator n=1 Tax=unclassified Rhodococcus (in: high G+C Gram-positive bacteria) TaxID=192944 RepID=UPI00036A3150|nr:MULTISPECIES: GntR family transcriptional regulator [unclassified Rhodococcus (in: high G+C Gram-positive bacteria)]OZC46874.1 GntR family transcriptional regulator [Rhodococcus sp. 06-621-2]OZC53028.1 GntR family transcriptional regulator [Rhodococcus sp. RS1C4]OZC77556.1 GntR family transcriptional regulator [Rhodococcus sp. 06-418-1B]OZC77631.1 GntR family transcriptional regulator [Rhodococcus sp. 06-418-1B]OZD62635.1 GntR family transcriptional regulator [Rhodococcus sp. 06-1059B-a]
MSKEPTAAEHAYVTVKEMIVTGELPGGELVSEGDIAGRMNISRTPVREAFLRLQVEGWMRLYPKRGALVVPIAANEAEHVVSARWLVETGSVRVVAASPHVRERLLPRLRANLAEQREIAATGTRADFSAADADFHRLIVRAGANPLLDAFYDGLRERQRRMTTHSLARDPDQISRIVDDHSRLADLIEAADVDGFGEAVDTHMRRTHGLDEGGAT